MYKCIFALVMLSLFTTLSIAAEKTIYFGGDIITMEGDEVHYVEAVVEQEGRILYKGDRATAQKSHSGKINAVDLDGQISRRKTLRITHR